MFLTKKHLSRRAVLKGMGATIALPFLEAMIPSVRLRAFGASARQTRQPSRLVCIEMVHGAAGSSPWGLTQNLWAPAASGRDFDLAPTSLRPLEPFRRHLTIISNTDVPSADPTEAREIGGDHFRSSATYLTQSYPKRTEGSDVEAGISLDQLYAQRFGQDTPIPSMQLCIESVDQSGGCGYGYSCAYTDAISWAAPNRPLPMIRDPRVVFDQMYSVFGAGATPAERRERREEDRSILDWVQRSSKRLQRSLGATDRARLSDYLDNVREIERRIQVVEARNGSGEPREIPGAPDGVPDSFADHVKMMFDLQLLAFRSDLTRVFAFKLGRDGSNRALGGVVHLGSLLLDRDLELGLERLRRIRLVGLVSGRDHHGHRARPLGCGHQRAVTIRAAGVLSAEHVAKMGDAVAVGAELPVERGLAAQLLAPTDELHLVALALRA